ncbi:phage integrase family protein [Mycobacterium kansasii]|uniref:Phage integrase family protein n=1 Tax=Mycobacterium kansasii TaxID=1768 RepID=A0A1V3X046_MYCKA|nr:phage integrase family protein [Mycobacterium kansasii]
MSNFRPFLKFTGRADLVNALNLAGVKRFHAIVPLLGDADEELVVRACASGVVSARDAAITLLALTTGLRACDIVALRIGDVDWRGHTIGIVQQKTGNPLTLPLPALLLGKLASYVLDERPSSGDDHLFLRMKAPHTRLNDHATVHRVTVETFRKAGWPRRRREPGCCATTPHPGCWPQRFHCRRSRQCWATPAKNRRTST